MSRKHCIGCTLYGSLSHSGKEPLSINKPVEVPGHAAAENACIFSETSIDDPVLPIHGLVGVTGHAAAEIAWSCNSIANWGSC